LTRKNATNYIADDAVIAAGIAEKINNSSPIIHVWNKADAVSVVGPIDGIHLSAKSGAGLEDLRRRLLETVGWQSQTEGIFIARERHLQALKQVNTHLSNAKGLLAARAQSLDLLAEELRLGQNALSEITGEFSSDDLLGTIFSKFCIGK
jgi:tRNA modification GTPase